MILTIAGILFVLGLAGTLASLLYCQIQNRRKIEDARRIAAAACPHTSTKSFPPVIEEITVWTGLFEARVNRTCKVCGEEVSFPAGQKGRQGFIDLFTKAGLIPPATKKKSAKAKKK